MSENKQSKVSMVVPCYNKAPYIGRMFQSVLEQRWDNIELVLVNDGSTDGTREIILEWIPRFKERGFSVVFVDQANQGVAAAIKNGMRSLTGDYFCTVDCDDMLDSEYASAMAGFLDENADYGWAACDYEVILPRSNIKRITDENALVSSRKLTEYYIVGRVELVTVRYMVRKSYLTRCGLPENMAVKPSVTQEPQIFLPLSEGGGKMKHIKRVLYSYIVSQSAEKVNLSVPRAAIIANDFLHLHIQTIARLNVSEARKSHLYAIALVVWPMTFVRYVNYLDNTNEFLSEMSNAIQILFEPVPKFDVHDMLNSAKCKIIMRAIYNCALGDTVQRLDHKTENGRVIGYGALGKMASLRVPIIVDTPIKPDVLWDENAKEKDSLYGIPITKPDFNSLTSDDVVLVFPIAHDVVKEMMEPLRICACHTMDDYALLDYLSYYLYPGFYECKYMGVEYKRLLLVNGIDLDSVELNSNNGI